MAQAAANPGPGYAKHPEHEIRCEASDERVLVRFAGEVIADSARAVVMHEGRYPPVHYFPRADVRMDLMQPTAHSTYCPFKGEASYFSITAADRTVENAVWSYETPYDEVLDLKDYVAFYSDKVDSIDPTPG